MLLAVSTNAFSVISVLVSVIVYGLNMLEISPNWTENVANVP